MEANRSTEPFKRAAVDPGAAVKDWNKTYGHLPGYKKYGKYPALSSRLSRDKLLLRKHLRTAMAREGKQEQMQMKGQKQGKGDKQKEGQMKLLVGAQVKETLD